MLVPIFGTSVSHSVQIALLSQLSLRMHIVLARRPGPQNVTYVGVRAATTATPWGATL